MRTCSACLTLFSASAIYSCASFYRFPSGPSKRHYENNEATHINHHDSVTVKYNYYYCEARCILVGALEANGVSTGRCSWRELHQASRPKSSPTLHHFFSTNKETETNEKSMNQLAFERSYRSNGNWNHHIIRNQVYLEPTVKSIPMQMARWFSCCGLKWNLQRCDSPKRMMTFLVFLGENIILVFQQMSVLVRRQRLDGGPVFERPSVVQWKKGVQERII
jgi:hypothetical protein